MYRRMGALLIVALVGVTACNSDKKADNASSDPSTTKALEIDGRTAPEGDAFYEPPDDLADFQNGDLIWASSVPGPAGSQAWKVLYRSESIQGDPIAVSGVVAAPTGTAPDDGRPVVTWAHGTAGVADSCAPSKQADLSSVAPEASQMIVNGWVIAATDYEGLGTPGRHPFLVGNSEGRGVLDIVRAAQQIPAADAGNQVVIFGHSQGGHAAAFAAQEAKSYAPDLDVVGTAAGAPVGDLELLLPIASSIDSVTGFVVLASAGWEAAYPEVSVSDVLTPQAETDLGVVDEKCVEDVIDFYTKPAAEVFAKNPADVPAIAELLKENSPGNVKADAPVLVFHGDADELIPLAASQSYLKRACANGSQVELSVVPGATHGTVLDITSTQLIPWISDRFAGTPAGTSCPG